MDPNHGPTIARQTHTCRVCAAQAVNAKAALKLPMREIFEHVSFYCKMCARDALLAAGAVAPHNFIMNKKCKNQNHDAMRKDANTRRCPCCPAASNVKFCKNPDPDDLYAGLMLCHGSGRPTRKQECLCPECDARKIFRVFSTTALHRLYAVKPKKFIKHAPHIISPLAHQADTHQPVVSPPLAIVRPRAVRPSLAVASRCTL